MRKNSTQILNEVMLEYELSQMPAESKLILDIAIDDLTNFKTNELEALLKMMEIRLDCTPSIQAYIMSVIVNHSRTLLEILGLTVEGFKTEIEDLEKKREAYNRIRKSL